jgi:uncharacterized protein
MLELPVKNQTPYIPVTELILYVSEECNLRCTYCFVNKKPRRMTLETGQKAVDYFLNRNISGTAYDLTLSFFGGEPMLETELISQLIAYAKKPRDRVYKKIRFGATTNGTLAGPQVEKVIREGQLQLLISLDGDQAATRQRPLVSGADSYPMIAKNLKRLIGWSPQAGVRMTYHPGALNVVHNIKHAIELGATSIYLCPVVEADWSGLDTQVDELHQSLAEWFLREFRQGQTPPLEVTWSILRQYHKALYCKDCLPKRPCQVAAGLLAINVQGNVMPCHRYLYRPQDWLGTVADSGLPAQREQYLKLHSPDFTECQSCEANRVCGGGCRVVAIEGGHGLHGIHPYHCLTMRAHYRAAVHIYQELLGDLRFQQLLTHPERFHGALRELSGSVI